MERLYEAILSPRFARFMRVLALTAALWNAATCWANAYVGNILRATISGLCVVGCAFCWWCFRVAARQWR